ncbi:MAG: hypothetical protein LBD17_05295 [Endomicrobium sp.]|jgi:hypothetical protein|nr:hypothetical protein [Endomicrobium sp.]
MRLKEFKILTLFLIIFLFIYSTIFAEYKSFAKKYSVLGDSKQEIFSQFDEYDKFHNIESLEPSGTIISEEYISTQGKELPQSVQEIAGQEILNYFDYDKSEVMKYSPEKWRKKDKHFKIAKNSDLVNQSDQSGITAELPFESKLSLSGRKLIGFNYTSRRYDKEEFGKRKNNSTLKMEQELQMKVIGSIDERLNVNIDYDDTAGKKDISIVYKGRRNEFVKEVSFGDISVAMPATEFTGYKKELFGLKIDTEYKRFCLNTFLSKTKGLSEVKRFTGSTQLERKTIADTSYVKLRYYSLLANGNASEIKNGSVKVFIDYQKNDPKYNYSYPTGVPLEDLNRTPGFSYTGTFVMLVQGQDFIVDYTTGMLVFRNTLSSNYIVAVSYDFTDGTSLPAPLIIKDSNNTAGITTELKTVYNLGNLKIVRDNGRGNFLLEIKELNDSAPTDIDGGRPVPSYPSNITVDFENGYFRLSDTLHNSLYSAGEHKYNFVTEYQYTIKILTLRPGIVPLSEKVIIDGNVLKNGPDYIIDYDIGILTIKNDAVIKENSVMDISYDYSLFGSGNETSLVGANTRLNLTDSFSIGASIISNFTSKRKEVPDIKNTPTSLTISECDAKITDLDIDFLNMKINANAEYVLSSQNNNTSGKASIDSMDNAVKEDLAHMLNENWFHSANAAPLQQVRRNLSDLSWRSYEISLRDIDPFLELTDGERQLVLDINYDVRVHREIAFSQKLCSGWEGIDYSKKLYIDIWINDPNPNEHEVFIEYASCVNEDADGDGELDTEDTDHTGILSPWKDTGQPYHNADGTVSFIGAHNGKLDTEDINGNGILDTEDEVAGSFSLSSSTVILINSNPNGWRQLRIPIDINDTNRDIWRNIRILRVKICQTAGGFGDQGKLTIGKIAICGNRWEKIGVNLNDFNISSIGRFDAGYRSLMSNKYYLDLYGIKDTIKKDERALKIEYTSSVNNEQFLAKSVYYGEALDLSKYESLRFMVYAKHEAGFANDGDVIIFRAGGNDDNYFEYRVTITDEPVWQDWNLIEIKQSGIGHTMSWATSDPNAQVTIQGNPSLENISQLIIGVESSHIGEKSQVWFNEIHVTGTILTKGNACKTGGSLQWKGNSLLGMISVGASKKVIDKDFRNITAGIYNRDFTEENAYFDFEGLKTNSPVIKLFPLKTGISRIETITPKVSDNKSNLISLNEEGHVIKYYGYAETDLKSAVSLPKAGIKYDRTIIDTSKIKRLEDKESISGEIVYNVPVNLIILPTSICVDAKTSKSYFKVYPQTSIESSKNFLGMDKIKQYFDISNYHTLERSNFVAFKAPFKFTKGITFSPGYSINIVSEKNRDFPQEIEYRKSLNQGVGASLILGLADWFSPIITYSINTKENYNVRLSTSTETSIIPGQKKYIERLGIGEISWNLNAYDITSFRLLKSLSFSSYYKLQDSDSYDNVNKDFESIGWSKKKLWIRNNQLMDIEPFCSSNTYTVKTILNRNDIRLTSKYMQFEAFSFRGFLSPLNSISVNCTYMQGKEKLYKTGTDNKISTIIWPDILLGISGLEKFFCPLHLFNDTQLNLKYNNKTVVSYNVSSINSLMEGVNYRFKFLRRFDLFFELENTKSKELSYNTLKSLFDSYVNKYVCQGAVGLGHWRFSLRYENESSWKKNALGKYSSNIHKNSCVGQINADLIFPAGLKIPLIGKAIPLRNRMILISNLKHIGQKSDINVEKDNNINYGVASNIDYEISRYFRLIVGVSYDRFEFRYNRDLNYYDLTIISKLTIQF